VIPTEAGQAHRWSWPELLALPSATPTVDSHCVTKWSKRCTTWQGASMDTMLAEVETADEFALVQACGGHRTNLPLDDLLDGQAWIACRYHGGRVVAGAWGPASLLVTHLYLWKSARWARGIQLLLEDEPGFWETVGYHDYGDPWREQRYQGD
jgi:DMSO/TMAO reductase YedYZ molybdopterin-dependent catalytic subunit